MLHKRSSTVVRASHSVAFYVNPLLQLSATRAGGIDTSHWSGKFLKSASRYQIDFMFTKLTQGTYYTDPSVPQIWEGGMKDVLFTGLYHYQTNESWKKQADYFLAKEKPYAPFTQARVLDVEPYGNTVTTAFLADVRHIIEYWHTVDSKLVILYTNPDILNNYLYPYFVKSWPDGKKFLDDTILWIAQYWNIPSPDKNPYLGSNRAPDNWTFYQFTEQGIGKDWGVEEKAVDVCVFNGSVGKLAMLAGTEIPDTPPVIEFPVQDKLFYAQVSTNIPRMVRTEPVVTTSTETTLRLNFGDKLSGSLYVGDPTYLWLEIAGAENPAVIGKWVAVRRADGTSKYLTLYDKPFELPVDELPTSRIFHTRKGRDALLLKKIGFGEKINFGHLTKWSQRGQLGDVHQFLYLSKDWLNYLLDIQLTNQTIEEDGDIRPVTRTMQYNWLYAKDGRPYLERNGRIVFGDCVVPDQPIRIHTDAFGRPLVTSFDNVRFRDATADNVAMVEVAGFTPDMYTRDPVKLQKLIDDAYIVNWTAVSAKGETNFRPKGIIRQINWQDGPFESNMGKKYIPRFYLTEFED